MSIDPAQVGAYLGIFAFLFALYMKLRSWEKGMSGDADRTQISPQPLMVKFADEFARRAEVEREINRLETRIEQGDKEILARIQLMDTRNHADAGEAQKASEARVNSIHARIDDLLSVVRRVEGVIEQMHREQSAK